MDVCTQVVERILFLHTKVHKGLGYIQVHHIVHSKPFGGESFCGFHDFSLNYESFPMNMTLSISLQVCTTKFSGEQSFYNLNVKVFPLKVLLYTVFVTISTH